MSLFKSLFIKLFFVFFAGILNVLLSVSVQAIIDLDANTGSVEYPPGTNIDSPLQNTGTCSFGLPPSPSTTDGESPFNTAPESGGTTSVRSSASDADLTVQVELGVDIPAGIDHRYIRFDLDNGATWGSNFSQTYLQPSLASSVIELSLAAGGMMGDVFVVFTIDYTTEFIPQSAQIRFCPPSIKAGNRNPVNIRYRLFENPTSSMNPDISTPLRDITGELLSFNVTPPTANFTVVQNSNQLSISLDASQSTDSDGTITDWQWTVSGGQTASGQTATFNVASAGIYTVSLTITDNDDQTTTAQKTVTVNTPQYSLNVSKTGTGTGNVTGQGINCGSDCSEILDLGTLFTLTATPSADSDFTGWSGACSGTDTCQVTMSQAQNVTATFALKTYDLNISKSGAGTGTVTGQGIDCGSDCAENLTINTQLVLTATPYADSDFTGWTGVCSGTSTCQVIMNQAQNIMATFALKAYAFTVNKAGTGTGSVTGQGINCGSDCTESFTIATQLTLTATPDADSSFTGWTGDCDSTGKVTLDSDKTCTATFVNIISQYDLNINIVGSGTITTNDVVLSCTSSACTASNIAENTSITLAPTPDTDYVFTGWSGNCDSSGIVTLNSDKICTATFAYNPEKYALNINVIGEGIISSDSIALSCSGAICTAADIVEGTNIKLTANAGECYQFKEWTGECQSVTNNICTLSMGADKTVSAVFEKQSYRFDSSTSTGGSVAPPSGEYACGEQITVTATPTSGNYWFIGWAGDLSGNTNPANVTLNQDTYVEGIFAEKAAPSISPQLSETVVSKAVTLKAIGGTPPYQWSSDNGTVQPTEGESVQFLASSEGLYTVTVKDGNGEQSQSEVQIYQPLSLSAYKATLKSYESKTFTVSGGKAPYSISSTSEGSDSSYTSIQSDGTFTFTAPSEAGTVTLTISDNLEDSLSPDQSIVVTVMTAIPPAISPETLTLRPKESHTFTATGGMPDYIWSVDGGNLSSTQGESVTYVAPDTMGSYTLTVTDNRSDTATAHIEVVDTLDITPKQSSVILTDSTSPLTFTALGGVSPYIWTVSAGEQTSSNASGSTEIQYTPPAQVGEYTVIVTDADGNSATAFITVVSIPLITPSYLSLTTQENIPFEVTGGEAPYTWTAEKGNLSTKTGARTTYTPLQQTGSDIVTVADAFGNISRAQIEVIGNLQCSPLYTTTPIGQPVTLTALKGSGEYTWQEDGTISPTWQGSFEQTGRQEIIVTDSANDSCLMIIDVIREGLNISPQNPTTETNTILNFTVSGGGSPYIWDFEAGSLSSTEGQRVGYITPDTAGIYMLTATDSTGMQGSAHIIVDIDTLNTQCQDANLSACADENRCVQSGGIWQNHACYDKVLIDEQPTETTEPTIADTIPTELLGNVPINTLPAVVTNDIGIFDATGLNTTTGSAQFTAAFAGNDATWKTQGSILASESIAMVGNISVDTQHLEQSLDILVVGLLTGAGQFDAYYAVQENPFHIQTWEDGQAHTILTFRTVDATSEQIPVNMYEGILPFPGAHLTVFFGYRVTSGDDDGTIFFNLHNPLDIDIQ